MDFKKNREDNMNTITETTSAGHKIHYKIHDGTAYHKETSHIVVKIIDEARLSNRTIRLRFYFGDTNTGRDWEETYDTTGYIGRSTGRIKIPLLIKNIRSTGGPAILDHCIVKIEKKVGTKYVTVYSHLKYHKDKTYLKTYLINNP